MRNEYFASDERKNGDAPEFRVWLKDIYNLHDHDIDAAMKVAFKREIIRNNPEMLNRGKDLLHGILREARPIEELKKEFYSSWEYKEGYSTDFYKWIDENNYKIKDGESTIRKIFKKTREWDKKIMFGGAKLLGKAGLGVGKLLGGGALGLGKLGKMTLNE